MLNFFPCLGLGLGFDTFRSSPVFSLQCREVSWKERNRESVRGREGKKKRLRGKETTRGDIE